MFALRWLLVATPGHGLRQSARPSVNFIVADRRFAEGYLGAARTRHLRHGLLIRRAAIAAFAARRGFELADVRVVRHPNAIPGHTVADDWKYDIGKYRHGSVDALSHAGFVRLATPSAEQARHIWIPSQAIVKVW
jgi:hypothetical protein